MPELLKKNLKRYQYNNGVCDELSGLYCLRARYYNPRIGRFAQEDVVYNDGLNLYAYCRSNSVIYSDPSGFASTPTGIICKIKEGSNGTLNHGIPNNPKTVRRFMSKKEYKQFKKNGFVFNSNDPRGGISSTSVKIRPCNPDMIKKVQVH